MVKGEENSIAYNKALFDRLANDIMIFAHAFVDECNRRIDPRAVTAKYDRIYVDNSYGLGPGVCVREDIHYVVNSHTGQSIHQSFASLEQLRDYFRMNMMCTSYTEFLEQQQQRELAIGSHSISKELQEMLDKEELERLMPLTLNPNKETNLQTQTNSMEPRQTHTPTQPTTKKKREKKVKKFEKLTPDPRTTFGKFGLELTFMPNVKLPDIWVTDSNESIWHEVTRQMSRSVKDDANISHDWWENIEMDDNGLELPTPTVETFDEFMVEYKKLSKELKHWGLVPSSNICMESEGGCHQNFDLEWMTNLHGNTFSCNFLFNLINYIRTYPSITWCFLSPYDNISSTLGYHNEGSYVQNQGRLNNWSKGDFLTVHGSPAYHDGEPNYKLGMNRVDYVELRFFMMPRNNREMKCHWEFTNKLLLYIYHKTCEGVKFEKPEGQNKDSFKEITYQKAKSMVNKVCTDIGYDFVELKRVGKFDLLQQRFDLGEEYLR